MGTDKYKWHVHCPVCGGFLEKAHRAIRRWIVKNVKVHWKCWYRMILFRSILS